MFKLILTFKFFELEIEILNLKIFISHWVGTDNIGYLVYFQGLCKSLSYLPNIAIIPQRHHMTRLIPTLSEFTNTPLGDIKIPEPIIVPTINAIPLKSPTWKNRNRNKRFILTE